RRQLYAQRCFISLDNRGKTERSVFHSISAYAEWRAKRKPRSYGQRSRCGFGQNRLIGQATTSVSMSVPLTGTGMATGQMTAAPGNLSFPSIQSGKSEQLTETLTNSTSPSVTISNATVAGTGFTLTSPSFPVTIAANQSVGIVV